MPTAATETTKLHRIQRHIARLKKERKEHQATVRRHQRRRRKALALAKASPTAAGRKAAREEATRELVIVRRHREAAQTCLHDIRALRSEAHVKSRLIRWLRHNRKVIGKNGLTWVDGHQVATWVAKILLEARADGVHFTVTSGIRTLATAQYLWNNAGRLGLIHYVSVAYPCSSNHCGYVYPKGAADCSPPWSLIAWLRRKHAQGKHTELKSYHDVVGSRDDVHFSHTGH